MIHANFTAAPSTGVDVTGIAPTSQNAFERLSSKISQFARMIRVRRWSLSQFEEIESDLATLPLASDEYAVACCRLRNARNCTFQGEYGAAHYELKLLANGLFDPQRIHPRPSLIV